MLVKYANQRHSPLLAVVPAQELAAYQLLFKKLEDFLFFFGCSLPGLPQQMDLRVQLDRFLRWMH